MRILLLEDDARDADLIGRALAAAGLADGLVLATTLQQAREILAVASAAVAAGGAAEAGGFDLLLSDLRLPDGHGFELIVALREQGSPLTVVALTGQGDESMAVAALRAGADDYLVKRDDLHERLGATLRAAHLRRQADSARRGRTLQLLYVEPQALDVDLARRHLERHAPHLRLQAVPDAAAALALLPGDASAPCAYDILLVDYRLPGDSGLDLLKTLREQRGLDIPVVLATGQGTEDVAAEALRLGATDYLPKNAHLLQLLPLALENAYHRVAAAREQAALRRLNAELEQRVAERTQALQASTRALEASNRELDAFAYSVSHDLRAPLRAIDGLSSLLLRDHAAGVDADGRHMLELLRGSALRMDRLIRDLLRFARGAREPLLRSPVAVGALVQDCLAEHADEITRRGIVVQLPELPDAQADATLLRQVFANLIDNAVKYTRHQAQPRIEFSAEPLAGGGLAYAVRDNGAGFDMRYAGKLFGVFQRLHRADEFEGTGVGLAIAARIIERHGGHIRAEAAVGQGAYFVFSLNAPAAATES
ncbi:sensor histidine kinase [Aquabacterium sp. OR-4]|uniref:sensor histidine kinase n=1 Tax=Aquabacterium sp. OR-4 TaxID=2978127 RepID=UPI0021B48F17|nr:response regulator [Aquabacterium sp. OR-4]MDT7834590.1 response regulator [Aquabacterium sp. OR-4]